MKRAVEAIDHFIPDQLSLSDLIKLLLNRGGKVEIYNWFKIFYEKIVYNQTDIRWEEFCLFGTSYFAF